MPVSLPPAPGMVHLMSMPSAELMRENPPQTKPSSRLVLTIHFLMKTTFACGLLPCFRPWNAQRSCCSTHTRGSPLPVRLRISSHLMSNHFLTQMLPSMMNGARPAAWPGLPTTSFPGRRRSLVSVWISRFILIYHVKLLGDFSFERTTYPRQRGPGICHRCGTDCCCRI